MMTQQKPRRRRKRVKKNKTKIRMKLIDIIGILGWLALIYAAVVLWLV